MVFGWAKELDDSKKPVIVEGIKDKEALEFFEIKNKIFTLSKKPIFAVVEDVIKDFGEVVILTDFDKEGKKLYGRLRSNFERFDCVVDNYFREFLQKNLRISHVEGLTSFFQRLTL